MKIDKVIGTSSKDSDSICINPVTGDLCYLAGSLIVIYSVRDGK